MFLLVSVRHVGAHPDELQHGVSIQSSINLGKTFPRVSRIRIIPSTQILARALYIYLLSFPRFWTLSVEWFWFWFLSILNGVTLKTSNSKQPKREELSTFKDDNGKLWVELIIVFLDAVAAVDVLTAGNNDVKLVETRTLNIARLESSYRFDRINKLDRDY